MDILPVPEWKDLVTVLKTEKGTALVLGKSDSGKSTLTRYLVRELLSEEVPVALVDSDIGQSSLGLPGTISMKIFRKPADADNFRPGKMFFVGGLNPAYHIPRVIEGTRRMVLAARRGGIKEIIVDTSGLVLGDLGRALKAAKIKAIKPVHIIALQENGELEDILRPVRAMHIHRLRRAGGIRDRNRTARTRYRESRFSEYFRNSGIAALVLSGLEMSDVRRKESQDQPARPGTLVGMNRGEDTLALGVLVEYVRDRIALKTPLTDSP